MNSWVYDVVCLAGQYIVPLHSLQEIYCSILKIMIQEIAQEIAGLEAFVLCFIQRFTLF